MPKRANPDPKQDLCGPSNQNIWDRHVNLFVLIKDHVLTNLNK